MVAASGQALGLCLWPGPPLWPIGRPPSWQRPLQQLQTCKFFTFSAFWLLLSVSMFFAFFYPKKAATKLSTKLSTSRQNCRRYVRCFFGRCFQKKQDEVPTGILSDPPAKANRDLFRSACKGKTGFHHGTTVSPFHHTARAQQRGPAPRK